MATNDTDDGLIRLQKVLAAAGLGSRRACEALIDAGRVEVDGKRVREQGLRVDPRTAVIRVDGERVPTAPDTAVYAFNKPRGVISTMSDDDIWRLNRGGHDPHKVYAAYAAAAKHTGQPTVILAKTIKGYGMGEAGEAQNITHQQKKMGTTSLKAFRNRFGLDIPDDKIDDIPYLTFPEDSAEFKYMRERRVALGGTFHRRKTRAQALQAPPL